MPAHASSFDAEFDALTPAREELATRKAEAERADKLGVVIGGSLSEGLAVKLDRDISLEDLAVGRYVVARGRRARFFCMITDVALDSTNPLIAKQPPDMSDDFLAAVHQGTTTFGTVHLSPLLILEDNAQEPKPVKTVPAHFTSVATASQAEVDQVFGQEGVRKSGGKDVAYFHIGAPLDMENVKITLNLARLVERSSGVNEGPNAPLSCASSFSGVQPSARWMVRIGRGWLNRKISLLRTENICPEMPDAASEER